MSIKLELSIDELISGATPALDFTGDDVSLFAQANGLQLLELPRFQLGSSETLSSVTMKNYNTAELISGGTSQA